MTNNILTASVTVTCIRPLLWNAFTPDAIPLTKQERSGVAGNDPEEWRKKALLTSQGVLYLESTYIFGCLRDGAKHSKKGRGSLQPLLVATLQVADDRVLTNRTMPAHLNTDPEQAVYLDVRSVKNPGTKARNVRYRVAAAPGWQASFRIEWDCTVISRQEMEAIAIDAGRLVGLGDGRAIGFGRFTVTDFTVAEA